MNANLTARKNELEAAMSRVAGFGVELTVRGELSFTASAEGEVDFSRLAKWLKSTKVYAVSDKAAYDAECDFSCLYFEVAAS